MLQIQKLIVPSSTIDLLHKDGFIERDAAFTIEAHGSDLDEGGFVLLTAEEEPKKSALGVLLGDRCVRVVDKSLEVQNIKPRDKAQVCAMWSLHNLPLTVMLGGAGTGKTTLAIGYALHHLLTTKKNVVISKPTRLVGGPSDAWGTLPGGTEEKMQPYIESFILPMKKVLGDMAQMHMDRWIKDGRLTVQPLETIRGMSFEDCVVILDEAQNCTLHELMSFISRVAENSKCIILGDPAQIDIDCRWRDTGLSMFLNSDAYYNSIHAKGVKLTAQYRGPLAQLAAETLQEFSSEKDEQS